jgi:LPLT family lysophospholipid transporter-like MFS transporter
VLTAGRSIAVQGFNENASVLAMLAVYGSLMAAQMPIRTLMWGFGAVIAAAMCALSWRAARSHPATPG